MDHLDFRDGKGAIVAVKILQVLIFIFSNATARDIRHAYL
jgi:hypothetical protein